MSNTVSFKVDGSDLTSYFDRIKQKGNDLTNTFIDNARKESDSSKKQVDLIEDQIIALEKRNRSAKFINDLQARSGYQGRLENIGKRDETISRLSAENIRRFRAGEITKSQYERREGGINYLRERNTPESIASEYREFAKKQNESYREEQLQTRLTRENLDAVKEGAKANVKAVKDGDKDIAEIISSAKTPEEKLAARYAQEQLESEKGGRGKFGVEDLIGSYILSSTASKLINGFSQLTQTKNGFDIIQGAGQTTGGLIGTIVGSALGGAIAALTDGAALPLIATLGAAGDAVGSSIGGATAGLEQRRAIAQQEFLATQNKYFATTGVNRNNFGTNDDSDIGVSRQDFINLMRETARTAGSSANAEKYTEQALIAEKGYGVSGNISDQLIQLQRYGRGGEDIENIIGGVLERGGNSIFKNNDRSFLNEFLGQFASLEKTLLRTNTNVNSGTTFDILSRFNSVGGQFSARDPRSLGLIEQINNSLVSPQGDNLNALSMLTLRRLHPEMGFFDLQREMSHGLDSPGYMNSMMKTIMNMGVDDQQKKYNIEQTFKINPDAALSLYNDYIKNPNYNFSKTDLRGTLNRNEAVQNTTVMESKGADITNKLLGSWNEAVSSMKDAFIDAIETAAKGVGVHLNDRGQTVYTSTMWNVNRTFSANDIKNQAARGRNPDGSVKKFIYHE